MLVRPWSVRPTDSGLDHLVGVFFDSQKEKGEDRFFVGIFFLSFSISTDSLSQRSRHPTSIKNTVNSVSLSTMLSLRLIQSMLFVILMMTMDVHGFAARNQPKHSAALINAKRSHHPQLPRKNKAVWWADAPHQGSIGGGVDGTSSDRRNGPASAGRSNSKSNKQNDAEHRRQWTFGRVPRFWKKAGEFYERRRRIPSFHLLDLQNKPLLNACQIDSWCTSIDSRSCEKQIIKIACRHTSNNNLTQK